MNCFRGKLLYLFNNKRGLLFRNQAFYMIDLQSGDKEFILSTCQTFSIRGLISHSRLANRLLRMEPRCIDRLKDGRFIICLYHKIWILNVETKTLVSIQEIRPGFSDPLNFGADNDSVYWGDYGDNLQHKEVRVYRLDSDLRVQVMYTFPQGAIRHIHSIIWESSSCCFYVLTGDLEQSAGIYVASENWQVVRPLAIGKQQFRSVIGFPYDKGFIYATDAVEEENSIYLIQNGEVKQLCPMPGSCIYGAEIKDYFVFTTTVEPSEGHSALSLFNYKLGKGIKDRNAHMFIVRKSDLKVAEILRTEKDLLPMRLFQYGAIMLPKGQIDNEDLWYYIMACKGDGKSFRVDL